MNSMKKERNRQRIAAFLYVLSIFSFCIPAGIAAGQNAGRWKETAVCLESGEDWTGILLAQMPANGRISLENRVCMQGEGVSAKDFSRLRYQPTAEGTEVFGFYPVYADGHLGELQTCTLTAEENHTPVAAIGSYETYRNMTVAGTLEGIDPDGEPLTVTIAEEPLMGTVSVIPETGSFLYTPYQNRIGTDHFTYCLTDESGAVSTAAEVTIRVSRPQSDLTYEDMKADPAQYAAVRLAELGIWQGSRIGDVSYFEPEKNVTRAEFIAMAVALAEEETVPTADTGFADNESIPVWARPFAAAALKTGIASGSMEDEARVLRAGDDITRAEAAVILCAAAQIPEAAEVETMADEEAIPAWAKTAVTSVCELGILECAGGSFEPEGTLTRAEAAQALYAAYCERERSVVKTGLFSWVL